MAQLQQHEEDDEHLQHVLTQRQMGETVHTTHGDSNISGGIQPHHLDDFDLQEPEETIHFDTDEPGNIYAALPEQAASQPAARATRPQSLHLPMPTTATAAEQRHIPQELPTKKIAQPWINTLSADMQLLLYVTGLHSQAKVQAVTEKLGILEPYQLYGISEETWTQYSVVLSNSALSLVETD